MLWRSYNEAMEPENDEIIGKSVNYAKRVILDYHQKMGERHVQEIRVFVDNARAQYTNELNFAFDFYNDKKNIGDIHIDDFKFIDDRILSAVKVYGAHLRKEKANLILPELEAELETINKIFERHSQENGDYDLYTELYKDIHSEFSALV